MDNLGDEWLEYMSEEITEDWYCRSPQDTEEEDSNAIQSNEEEDTAHSNQVVKYEKNDVYWSKVGRMIRPPGERKYQSLMKMARIALTLSHSNADIVQQEVQ